MNLDGRPHYIYRHYDADGVLLYVGLTVNPDRRPHERRERPFLKASVRCAISAPMSRAEALAAERAAIRDELPLHNVQENNGNVTAAHRLARALEAGCPSEGTPEWGAEQCRLAAAIDAALMQRRAS